jgi:hypothetical protein
MKQRGSSAGACNTPAVRATEKRRKKPVLIGKNAAGIDFLSATKKCRTLRAAHAELRACLIALKTMKAIGSERTIQGYIGAEICAGYGFIGRKNEELFLNLPGQAVEWIRRQGIADQQLCQLLASWRASRADLAIDTRSPDISPIKLWDYYRAGAVTCRADENSIRKLTSLDSEGHEIDTVYIGSTASTRMLRAYDKRGEREAKTGEKDTQPWTRCELQHRHAAADECIHAIARDGLDAAPRLINGWITFRELKGRKEVKKRPAARWWKKLVGKEQQYLQLDPRAATPERTVAWLASPGVTRAIQLARYHHKSEEIEREIEAAEPTATQRKKWQDAYGRKGDGNPLQAIKGR